MTQDYKTILAMLKGLERQENRSFRASKKGLEKIFDKPTAQAFRDNLIQLDPATAYIVGQNYEDQALVDGAKHRVGEMVLLDAYTAGTPSFDPKEVPPVTRVIELVKDRIITPVHDAGEYFREQTREANRGWTG